MTRHIQNPREPLYAEAVCGDTPWLTGGTGTRKGADCTRCIALYDQEFGPSSEEPSEDLIVEASLRTAKAFEERLMEDLNPNGGAR